MPSGGQGSGAVVAELTPQELAVIAAAQDAVTDVSTHNPTLANQIKAEAGKFAYTARMRMLIAQVRTFSPADANALTKLYSDPVLVKKYYKAVIDGVTQGIGNSLAAGAGAAGRVTQALGADVAHSASPIAGFFQLNLWLRVAEVGLGLLLVAVGVAKLTNAVPAATKVAAAVSKVPV